MAKDYHAVVYQMFLPDIIEMDKLRVFREKEPSITPSTSYSKSLDDRVAAAVLWGVAKRYGCDVTPIEAESEEEFDIRKVTRGMFDSTAFGESLGKTIDNVYDDLAAEGRTQEQVKQFCEQLEARIRENTEANDDAEDDAMDIDERQDTAEAPSKHKPEDYRVTKIDALYKIAGACQRTIVYCRGHTQSMGYDDEAFLLHGDKQVPNKVVDWFQSQLHDQLGYYGFFERIAMLISAVKVSWIIPSELLRRLEREVKERK